MADDVVTDESPAESAEAISTETLHGAVVTSSRGQRVLHPEPAGYLDLIRALHADGYCVCVDLTAVDYLTYPLARDLPAGIEPQRFEVVVLLRSLAARDLVRVRVQVPEDELRLPSITGIHPGADSAEREVFDLFGVAFDDHPDLTRIVLPEDWLGHPLRKDYESGRIPVQFKGAPSAR